jgi:endonuclease YncB( thermonuclease family)
VAAGWARADPAQPELKHAEEVARAGGLGVWATAANRGR